MSSGSSDDKHRCYAGWESTDGPSEHLSCPFCYDTAGSIEDMLDHLGACHLKILAKPAVRRVLTSLAPPPPPPP